MITESYRRKKAELADSCVFCSFLLCSSVCLVAAVIFHLIHWRPIKLPTSFPFRVAFPVKEPVSSPGKRLGPVTSRKPDVGNILNTLLTG